VELGPATFDPFQPAGGGALFVSAADWQTSCWVFRVTPRRPALAVTPPQSGPGPVRFSVHDAPPLGLVALHLGIGPLQPERALLQLGGLPLWLALDYGAPVAGAVLPADAAGAARFDFVYAGGLAGAVHGQAIGLAPLTGDAGTSPAATLLLRP
jgi:hypothetical protein